MPPSPALRCSPGRELRGANHKRGRSFEGGLFFREKDEDLALFNEMQTRESENFLLMPSDDIEDTFSTKLKHFSDAKLGISLPVHGESSDMLNVDGEKNDYDWLLTPPDTPLFPSLDDEPQPVNTAPRGRPQSQPISISRSSTMERSNRSGRGSASPNRLSPSPRSGSSTFQSRGRPSSSTHSSPPPGSRQATPSRRPSTPPSKPSTPAPRSSTPTPRRMSTGSAITGASRGIRGTSPIKTSRGNSASPKIRAWQANIPGFSSDAPPNLRTSLADRPASYVRGSSPASRNGRDSTSMINRQSVSPTASRSISSCHSHDRDRFSSHSKGSVASSGDDEIDSLQSLPVGSLDRATSRRVGALLNNQTLALSKKSPKKVSSTSAPKRSFDYALRQMDNRRSPQNMFRPLLSSVPSTTFHAGKSSSGHHSLISRNSSLTTSSNASSDRGASAALDTEGIDQIHDDTAREFGKAAYPDDHEEVFAFDKMDVANEDIGHEMQDVLLHVQHGNFDKVPALESGNSDSENPSQHGIAMEISVASESYFKADSLQSMEICLNCGSRYVVDEVEEDIRLCPDCRGKDKFSSVIVPDTTTVVTLNCPDVTTVVDVGSPNARTVVVPTSPVICTKISDEEKPSDDLTVHEFAPITYVGEPKVSQGEENIEQGQTSQCELNQNFSGELSRLLKEEVEHSPANPQDMGQSTVRHSIIGDDTGGQQLHSSNEYSNLKVDLSEGTGISILLKRSSSSKGPVVQGRTFTATSTIPYDDLSHVRESANSTRSSTGHGSFSASSSIDFSLTRQTDTRVQRQLSSRKSDLENYRFDNNTKFQRSGSSLSGISNHAHQASVLASSTPTEENFEVSVCNVEYDLAVETLTASEEQELEYAEVDVTGTSFTKAAVVEKDNFEYNNAGRTADPSSELLSHVISVQLEDNKVSSFANNEDCNSYENEENFLENGRSIMDMEASIGTPESSLEEEGTMQSSSVDGVDAAQAPAHSSLVTMSEVEAEECCQSTPARESSSDGDLIATVSEPNTCDHALGILEESTVMVDSRGGRKTRSLTLEEATDTILFCSSIVHDLAYEAASIAMEKESSIPLEGSRPTVTVLGKSNSDRKTTRGRTVGKRAPKAQKTRQKQQVETDAKPQSQKTENDENADESLTRNVGLPNKVDSTKPPKLESKCNCTIM